MKNASKTDALIQQASAPAPKIKASFNLDEGTYAAWRSLCEARHISQGDLLSAMMQDVLDRVGVPEVDIPVKKRRGRPKNLTENTNH